MTQHESGVTTNTDPRPPTRPMYLLDDRDGISWLARATCNPRGPEAVDFDDAWAVITYLRRNGIVLARIDEPEATR